MSVERKGEERRGDGRMGEDGGKRGEGRRRREEKEGRKEKREEEGRGGERRDGREKRSHHCVLGTLALRGQGDKRKPAKETKTLIYVPEAR